MDTKKKEVLGNHKNAGQTYRPKGRPTEVDTHDFPDPKLGKAIPYGVYDLAANLGWVSVGVDHDTAEFAVAHNHPATGILREAGILVLLGLAVGTGLALAAGGAAQSLLYGLKPTDPLTLGASILGLSLVAVIASLLPAQRAATVDPMVALREE